MYSCLCRTGVVLIAVTQISVLGCEKKAIEVTQNGENRVYGRGDLLAAVEDFARSDRSPEKYRVMAAKIEALEPRFDDIVRAEAERHLVVLALTPMEAHFQKPPEERQRILGTTVWPTAIGVPPKSDEKPAVYAERMCGGPLALECQDVVPEYRAPTLSAVIWERLYQRARHSIQSCDECSTQPRYQDVLDKYVRFQRASAKQASSAKDRGKPSRWPLAGDNALPWSNPPLLELSDGGAHKFAGSAIEPGDWTPVLTAAHQDHEILGVFVKASARVADLRSVLAEAHKAGFEQVALQVRERGYPYPLAEYRLATTPGEQTVRIRDIDTIQILVQALDVRAENGQRGHRI